MLINGANKENFLAMAIKKKPTLDKQFAEGQLSKIGYDNAVANNQKWIDFLTTLPNGSAVTPKMVENWNTESRTKIWALWQYADL